MTTLSEHGFNQVGFNCIVMCVEFRGSDGAILYAPDSVAEFLGYSKQTMAAMNVLQLFPDTEEEKVREILCSPADSRYRELGKFQMRKQSGEIFCASVALMTDENATRCSLFASYGEELPYEQHTLDNPESTDIESVQEFYDIDYDSFKETQNNVHYGLYDYPNETHMVASERLVEEFIQPLAPLNGKRLLEIGCGVGHCAIRLVSEFDCQVDAINVSNEQLAIARRDARDAGVDNKVNFQLMDANNMIFASNSFDIVFAMECIFHMDRQKVFSQVYDLLKPGGVFAFCDVHPIDGGIIYSPFGSHTVIGVNQSMRLLRKYGFKHTQVLDWTERVFPTYKNIYGTMDDFVKYVVDNKYTIQDAIAVYKKHKNGPVSDFEMKMLALDMEYHQYGTSVSQELERNTGYCYFIAKK